MESFADYYAILKIPPDASFEDITKAFRAGALKVHPDRNKSQDAAAQFIKIKQAYDVLKDPQTREDYDRSYRLHKQNLADAGSFKAPSSRQPTGSTHNTSPRPARDPGYTILHFTRGRAARVVLGNTSYLLSADEVDTLIKDGMLRGQLTEQIEYLLMYCVHCHALFANQRNHTKIGILYFPYDLFPLCPHCDALNWCPADEEREKRQREAETRREREAQERLNILREQNRRKAEEESRETAQRKEERRYQATTQAAPLKRQRSEKGYLIGFLIVVVGIIALALAPLFFRALTSPPAIINLHMVNPILPNSIIVVSFDYQPASTPGYIKAQFSTAGKMIDSQTLDTKDMTQGPQTVSTTAFLGTSYADGTVSIYWCPNYDCTKQQEMKTIHFTITS